MNDRATIHRGLRGIVYTTTSISEIDGEKGRLTYRGLEIERIVKEHTYEDVVHLLLVGSFPPSSDRKGTLDEILAAERALPGYVKDVIARLPKEMDPMSALRTAISALGREDQRWPPTVERAAWVIAKVPTMIAFRRRILIGKDPVEPDPALPLAANYLYMLNGERPSEAKARALDAYFILTAEHGMNASTFAARVTTSTQSDLISSVVSAVCALKGPLHGGAPSEVSHMLREIGEKERAEAYLRGILERGERIMGFGHRVYRTKDPRAIALAPIAHELAKDDPWLDLAAHVEQTATRLLEEYKPGRRLHTNVEFYAAAVLNAVELPPTLYTPTFAASRMAGWTAHILEQAADNDLIRPTAIYREDRSLSQSEHA